MAYKWRVFIISTLLNQEKGMQLDVGEKFSMWREKSNVGEISLLKD